MQTEPEAENVGYGRRGTPKVVKHGRCSAGALVPRSLWVFVVLAASVLMLVSGMASAQFSGGVSSAIPASEASASPSTIASTQVWLNQSQTLISGTNYVKEAWCELTSSFACNGAPFDLPSMLLVASGACVNLGWNTSASANVEPISPFHAMQIMNVTSANDSGTQTPVRASSQGISQYVSVCGGHAYWINYVEFTYTIYGFSAPTLGQNSSSVTATFGPWPGTARSPANVTAHDFGGTGEVQFVVPDNLSVRFLLPTTVVLTDTSSPQCDVGICQSTTYTFSAAVNGILGTNGTGVIQYGTIGSARGFALPGATYSNWTASYTSTSGTSTSGVGGFLLGGFDDAYLVFVTYGVVTLIVVLVLVAMAIAYRETHHAKGRRRH